MNLTAPAGASNVLSLPGSLAETLTGLRCDYASLAGLSLGAVRVPGGTQINTTSSSAATLATALAAANAATVCPPASRALLAAPAARDLASVATAPWASVAVSIGLGSTATAASQVAADVAAATAASFPRTTAAWAPVWGYDTATWVAAIGSPLALASTVAVTNAASFSPVPAAADTGLTTSQQLGLGLGIALPIAAILVVILVLAYYKWRRDSSNIHHQPSDAAATVPKAAAAAAV